MFWHFILTFLFKNAKLRIKKKKKKKKKKKLILIFQYFGSVGTLYSNMAIFKFSNIQIWQTNTFFLGLMQILHINYDLFWGFESYF